VLRRQLEAPETDFDSGRALMLSTIELLGQPQELYRQADDTGRKILNKAIFDRLRIDHDGEAGYITGDTLNEPFSTVVTYSRERRGRTLYKRSETENSTQDGVLSAVPADVPWSPCSMPLYVSGVRVGPPWWSWRESNPRPRAPNQVFSGCSR